MILQWPASRKRCVWGGPPASPCPVGRHEPAVLRSPELLVPGPVILLADPSPPFALAIPFVAAFGAGRGKFAFWLACQRNGQSVHRFGQPAQRALSDTGLP